MGDVLTKEQRSFCMSRIKGKNTRPELALRRRLHQAGCRFRIHDKRLPGSPDIVFPSKRVVVFVEGDFWHGWQFNRWKHKLAPFWREKIEKNRRRDRRNFARLRRDGWVIVRAWESQMKKAPDLVVARVLRTLADRSGTTPQPKRGRRSVAPPR